jgi:hypothetical protein
MKEEPTEKKTTEVLPENAENPLNSFRGEFLETSRSYWKKIGEMEVELDRLGKEIEEAKIAEYNSKVEKARTIGVLEISWEAKRRELEKVRDELIEIQKGLEKKHHINGKK